MAERRVGQLSLADSFVAHRGTSPLDRLATVIDWSRLDRLLGRRGKSGAGNASYPAGVLLRCLLLGVWYDLSDPALEEALRDRLSFRRFAGFGLMEEVPDHSTLWRFRNELAEADVMTALLDEINAQLDAKGMILRTGTLIDASLVAAAARPPRKRRDAEAPDRPSADADADARWGRKGNKSVFGYKVHIGADLGHTLIRRCELTNASVTDTEPADALICTDARAVYGDMAYYTHARHDRLRAAGIKDRLMRRPNKHHPKLSRWPKRLNRLIAPVRAAVERPFAVFKEHYGLRRMRHYTLTRNRVHAVLCCCAYNLRRATAIPVAATA